MATPKREIAAESHLIRETSQHIFHVVMLSYWRWLSISLSIVVVFHVLLQCRSTVSPKKINISVDGIFLCLYKIMQRVCRLPGLSTRLREHSRTCTNRHRRASKQMLTPNIVIMTMLTFWLLHLQYSAVKRIDTIMAGRTIWQWVERRPGLLGWSWWVDELQVWWLTRCSGRGRPTP